VAAQGRLVLFGVTPLRRDWLWLHPPSCLGGDENNPSEGLSVTTWKSIRWSTTSTEQFSPAAGLSQELANENRSAAGVRRPFLKGSLFRFSFAKELIEEEETTCTE
jgi:hypothetical protein